MRNFPHGPQHIKYTQQEVTLDPLKLARDRNWVIKIDYSQAHGMLGLENAEVVIARRFESEKRSSGKGKPPKLKEIAAATVMGVSLKESEGYCFDVLMCSTKKDSSGVSEVVRQAKFTVAFGDVTRNWQERVYLSGMAKSAYNEAFICMVYHLAKEADVRIRKSIDLTSGDLPKIPTSQ